MPEAVISCRCASLHVTPLYWRPLFLTLKSLLRVESYFCDAERMDWHAGLLSACEPVTLCSRAPSLTNALLSCRETALPAWRTWRVWFRVALSGRHKTR